MTASKTCRRPYSKVAQGLEVRGTQDMSEVYTTSRLMSVIFCSIHLVF